MKTLTPAYGRDYKSAKAAKKDFLDNKDFILRDVSSRWDGKPINGEQLENEEVVLRFSQLKKVCTVTYKKKGKNEMTLTTTEIKDLLSEKAQDAIDEIINEGMGKGKLKRRFHATGASTKHRVGMSKGQKMKNSGGRNERKRKIAAKKRGRSLKKKQGKIVSNKTKKLMKRGKAKHH